MSRTLQKAGVITACLVLLGSGLVLAQGRGPGDGPGPHGRMGRGMGPMAGVLHELDLTEEQRDLIRTTVHQKMGGELGEAMRESRDARRELEQLIADPVADEAAIRDALQRVGQATEQLALERHRLTVAVGEILTDEQREQYRELLAERPQRAPRRRPGGPPWGE